MTRAPSAQGHEERGAASVAPRALYPALLGLIAGSVLLLYWPMTRAWFAADDFAWLNDAAFFCQRPLALLGRDFAGFVRPGLHVVFAANYRLFGEWAPAYYIINIALHALNAALLFLLIHRLTRTLSLAALAAALFALAAPAWQATAWIAARPEGLLTAFALGCLLAFDRWKTNARRRSYAAVILLFVLAMASKETAVCLAPVLLVADKVVYGRVQWRAHAPIWILAGLVGLVAFIGSRFSTEWAQSFRIGPHVLTQMRDALVRIWGPLTLEQGYSWVWYIPAVVMIAAGVFGNRWQRLGVAWTALGLLPYSLLIPHYEFQSRHLYFASAGAQLAVAATIWAAWKRARLWPARAVLAAGVASLLWFHVAAVRPRLGEWRDLSHRLRFAAERRPPLPPRRGAVVLINVRFARWYLNYLYGRVPPYAIVDIENREPAILVGESLRTLLAQLEHSSPRGSITVAQREPLGFPSYRPLPPPAAARP